MTSYRMICSNCGDDFIVNTKYQTKYCIDCHYYKITDTFLKIGIKQNFLPKPFNKKKLSKKKFFNCKVIEEEI